MEQVFFNYVDLRELDIEVMSCQMSDDLLITITRVILLNYHFWSLHNLVCFYQIYRRSYHCVLHNVNYLEVMYNVTYYEVISNLTYHFVLYNVTYYELITNITYNSVIFVVNLGKIFSFIQIFFLKVYWSFISYYF